MIIELFMCGFFTCLISYVVCMALGLIVGVIIFGSSVTMLQAFVLTPLIGLFLSILFILIGFIVKICIRMHT